MAVLLLAVVRRYLRDWNEVRARVPDLVKLTLDRLATQAALHAQDGRAVAEAGVLVGQLRDDVLRDEFSARRREAVWKRVQAVVEANANVRASVKETRGGEVGRVWEWIGSIGLVDEAFSANRRGSGRLSWAPEVSSSPTAVATPTPVEAGQRSEMIQRGWTEGRPIY